MDTATLIIAICVIIPALIAISVCGIIFYSHRNKDRKFYRQRSSPYEYHHSRELVLQNNHVINFPRINQYQQQRRLSEPLPVLERSPPSYDNSVNQIRRQQLPLFSPVRTTPSTTHIHRASPAIIPSIYSAMPPSYAEIFLTPHTLRNR